MPTIRHQQPPATPQEREEEARLHTLRDYAILDTPPEAAFERIARLAARFLSAPIATVTLVDEHRQWFKAICGLDVSETPRRISFCTHTILKDEVMVVPDATLDERFADNPLVTGPPFVRFYAGAPLRMPNGQNLGALCVIDYRPRRLSPTDLQTLQELAATVVDELELRRAAASLRAEVAQRERAERGLADALRSVESQVEARTAELSHRNEQLCSEIVSRREAEAAARVAREEAELANSAKSHFLSRMSHELRTPLNAVLGFGQLLQMDAVTERQQECVEHVLAGGQQLLKMIDDVLDIARLEPGGGDQTAEAMPARAAILLGIDLIRPLAAPRLVTVELEESPAADHALLVNRQRFAQVLFHLLSNAVKYNLAGGRVTVSCREMPSARLRIAVTDTGPGIAQEDFERLFVPFDRLGAERGDVPGTGLGLALSKNLVEAQGGQIGVESVVGQGSTFWIQLPLAPPPKPAAPPAEPAAPRRASRPATRRVPRQRARSVLYVEDNLSNLRLIERLLQRRPGMRLLTATRGHEGLTLARRCRPDLVLLDCHLPDLSGREVLDTLQADPATRPIPVVIISANALPANIEAMLAAGAWRHITKPLDVHQLAELLAELA